MAKGVLRRETFAAGQAIFTAGDPSKAAYLIQAGVVEVTAQRDGHDVVLNTLVAGDLVGEMALVDSKPRSATAKAKQTATCVVVTPLELTERIERSDPFVRAMVRALSRKLRHTTFE